MLSRNKLTVMVSEQNKNAKSQILAKQIGFAIGQSATDVAGNGLCALILYIVFFPVVNKFILTGWLLIIILLVISRIIIGYETLRNIFGIKSITTVYEFYVPHIIFLGTMWGAIGIICFNSTDAAEYQFFLVVELAGVAAGAASSLPVFWRVYLAFLLQIMAPLGIMLVFKDEIIANYLGILTFLFMGYLAISSKRTHSIITEALQSRFHIEEMARIDTLTKIPNRMCFNENFLRETKRAIRNKTSLSLLLCDIDYFKKINDILGHVAGDYILEMVATVIARSVFRSTDMVARYGGEEFIVLLPETSPQDALIVAERIRSSVEKANLKHPDSSCSENVTISIGITTVEPDSNATESIMKSIIEMADKSLYEAKRNGRNCVMQ